MIWTCKSCGWHNETSAKVWAKREQTPIKCDCCRAVKGTRVNVSWIAPSPLIETQGPYHIRGEILKRRLPNVQTHADGTALG